jgi:hypothetical protein
MCSNVYEPKKAGGFCEIISEVLTLPYNAYVSTDSEGTP